ncbi:hypothetical protein [Streptomyces mirabilis]|uniref:hypothetical protein n=1 Tax=Streptomyces mirabilis TaxID=68239 RepID=UPI00371F3D60
MRGDNGAALPGGKEGRVQRGRLADRMGGLSGVGVRGLVSVDQYLGELHIGTNGSYQLVAWVVASTGVATVSTVLWAVMRKMTGRRRLLLPLVLTILASAMLLWPELAVWYVSPGHPDSMCEPGGTPVGWPSWLPL